MDLVPALLSLHPPVEKHHRQYIVFYLKRVERYHRKGMLSNTRRAML